MISICLPTLNARAFLEERMDSILCQTVTDWELIVCDSYSSDGTWEYLLQFASDPRIHLHQVPKEGLYAGWNECLRRAKGEYVYVATADDTMEPNCLEHLQRALESHPDVDLALSEVRRMDDRGNTLNLQRADIWRMLEPQEGRCERVPGSSFFLLLCGLAQGFGSVTGLLVRRRLFEKTGPFPTDQSFLGDCEWALKAVLHSDVLIVPGLLATWRRHGDQASSSWNLRAASIFLGTLERVLDSCGDMLSMKWRSVPSWRDRLTEARRAEAELATKLFTTNLRAHWRSFPRWIVEAAAVSPALLIERFSRGFRFAERHRRDAVEKTRRLLADFGEAWPERRTFTQTRGNGRALVDIGGETMRRPGVTGRAPVATGPGATHFENETTLPSPSDSKVTLPGRSGIVPGDERPDSASSIVHCPVCARPALSVHPENRATLSENGRVFENYSCSHCNLIFCHPIPSDDEIRFLYTERYDFAWFRRRAYLKRAQAVHRFHRLRSLWVEMGASDRPRFLDIGCGHGWLVERAQKAGWAATGIDFLADEQVRLARGRGVDLRAAAIEEFDSPPGSFDLVSMWHSLEHTSDPGRVLGVLGRLLADRGLLVIAVPNREAAGLEKMGAKWGWFQKPFIHPWCFSAKSLTKLLPEDLRAELVTSRDTWDQQWLQYTLGFRIADSLRKSAFRVLCGGLRRMGLSRLARLADFAQFVLGEGMLVAIYLGYLTVRRLPWIRDGYENSRRASELMMVLRKVRADAPGSSAPAETTHNIAGEKVSIAPVTCVPG